MKEIESSWKVEREHEEEAKKATLEERVGNLEEKVNEMIRLLNRVAKGIQG